MKSHNPYDSFPTQNELVLGQLERKGYITQQEATKLGCTRLAARIHELRGQGHDIKSEFVTVKTMSGEARIAKYTHEAS